MADLKISQLTGATTPLAGTEVLPIVQSGSTRQVSVANLTAGRTQTSNGVVQGTAGTGYNFTANTPAAGMTSQLLNWYEEGTFTPFFSCDGGNPTVTYTTQSGRYTRIGRQVFIQIALVINTTTGGTGQLRIAGLPFTASSGSVAGGLARQFVYNFVNALEVFSVPAGLDSVQIYRNDATNTLATNADLQAGAYCYVSGSYIV